MIYIKKVILENFQSHKYTELEFDNSLNVIVGPSDQGKSAVIRGIKWALFNEPSGDFFIREGETECSVTLIFNNNIKLKRYRSKTKNYYHLYDSNGQETIYEGFGTKVPKDIVDKISIRKVLLDENRPNLINIGEQLEGPFLLTEKNSTRANAIGRLVGVHIIDDALKDTLKDNRNLRAEKKRLEESVEKLTTTLSEYDYLDDLIIKANKLKDIKNSIYNKQLMLNELLQKHNQLKQINEEIKLLEEYLSKLKHISKISDLEVGLSNRIRNYKYIFTKQENLQAVVNNIKYNEKILYALKDIDRIYDHVEGLTFLIKKREKLNSLYNRYNIIEKEIFDSKHILHKLKDINKIEDCLSLMNTKCSLLINIFQLKSKLDSINKSISIGRMYTDKLSSVDPISKLKDTIEIKYDLLLRLILVKEKYDLVEDERIRIQNKLTLSRSEISKYLEQYRVILNKIEICPLCFSSIGKENIETIIQHFEKEEMR